MRCDFQRAGQKSVFFIQENATFIQVSIYQAHNQLFQAINTNDGNSITYIC